MHHVFDEDGHLIGVVDEHGNPAYEEIPWSDEDDAITDAIGAEMHAKRLRDDARRQKRRERERNASTRGATVQTRVGPGREGTRFGRPYLSPVCL